MAARMGIVEISKRYIFRALICLVLFPLCNCHGNRTGLAQHRWLTDGSITITQPVPAPERVSSRLLGFLPSSALRQGKWLSIDTGKQTVALMEGDQTVAKVAGQGVSRLQPGTYELLHKQRNALWYAPDTYFTSRKLPLPAEGDVERYRRGALGDFALFITKDTPLHSGPVWTDEIGGVQMPENDLAKIYYLLPVGAVVEVN